MPQKTPNELFGKPNKICVRTSITKINKFILKFYWHKLVVYLMNLIYATHNYF